MRLWAPLLGSLAAAGLIACTSLLGVTDVPAPGEGDDGGTGSSSGSSSGGSSGGTSGSSSGSSGVCKITWSVSACETCFEDNCLSQCSACNGNTDCNAFFACRGKCSTSACISGCYQTLVKAGGTGVTLESALLGDPTGCVYANCRAECTTPSILGDPCIVDADCTTGLCVAETVGWCSKECASNADCNPNNTAGNPNYCLKNSGGGTTCFPACPNGASDCASLECKANGLAPTCTTEPTVGGASKALCLCPN